MTKLCRDCAHRIGECCNEYHHNVGYGGPSWCRDVRADPKKCGPEGKDWKQRGPDLVWGDYR